MTMNPNYAQQTQQQPQQQYFQLRAQVPLLGEQHVGYVYTDAARAMALQLALQQCPGAQYRLLDPQGQPVVPTYGGGGGQPNQQGGGGGVFPGLPGFPFPGVSWPSQAQPQGGGGGFPLPFPLPWQTQGGGGGGGQGGGGWGY